MKYFFCFLLGLFFVNSKAQSQFSIYFDSDKYDLKKTEILKLNNWMTTNKDSKIVAINGFCDEDGSSILNDTLSKKRINFVYNLVKNNINIRADFKQRSFGKLHQHSKIKAENRKVIIFYLEAKDFSLEDEILGIKKVVVPVKIVPIEVIEENKYPKQLIVENIDGSKTEYSLDVVFMKEIEKSKAGEKLNIKNLNFIFNSFAVTNDSRSKLYELLVVLEQNPNLKIEVQGHICCNPNTKETLSSQRAKAVCSFLIANGIDKKRLSYKGFGSSFALFPVPEKTEAERAANRRVEILIIEN